MKGKLLLSDNVSILYHQLEGMERVLFMDAVFDYHENGNEPGEEVGRCVLMAFKLFKVEYGRDQEKYEEKCEILRNNARSKKANASKSNQMQADASKSNQIESNNNSNNNNNNNVTNVTDLFPPLSPKGETVYDWSLLSDDMKVIAEEWLQYKREKKQTYKPSGFKTFCKRLIQLSGNDSSKARLIIEQSMANNYSGIFELKNRTNEATSANIRNNKERHVADGDVHEQSLRIIGRLSAEGSDSD